MIGDFVRRRTLLLLALTAVAVLGTTAAASAASYTVNDTNDAPLADSSDTNCVSTDSGPNNCTLRAAVQAADNSGGSSTITVPGGDYKLTVAASCSEQYNGCDSDDPSQGDLDINNGANVTITGAGSGSTTIDANGIDRAFAVQSDVGTEALSLSGMTIKQGNPSSYSSGSQNGGGIWSEGGLAITSDVVFLGNSSLNSGGEGGAIFADSGSALTINGGIFNKNSAGTDGGSIYDGVSGTLKITNSEFNTNLNSELLDGGGAIYGTGSGDLNVDSTSFNGNVAVYGGGIYWHSSGTVKVTHSTFANNAGDWEYAGAIYDDASSSMMLTSDKFTGNTGGYAGALYLDSSSSSYTLDQDEFDNNSASFNGGAVLWAAGSSLSSTGSSFVGNSAGSGGGAIYDGSSGNALSLVNDTISQNTASFGGGIYLEFNSSDPAVMTNDTIAFNSAGAGDGGGVYEAPTAYGDDGPGVSNTIVGENTGGDCGNGTNGGATQFINADGGHNMDSDGSCFSDTKTNGPLAQGDMPFKNPMLGHPADNGGLVLTDSDLGSPAIDAGTTSCPPEDLGQDARGVTRPQGASCDMGAYEATPANLSVSKSAPASAGVNNPFQYTVTVTDGGPASSTNTSFVDGIPAGETLWSVSSSQGSCSASGGQVTCNLGKIDNGAHATVTMVVSEAKAGPVTNTATAANDEGSSASGSATTNVTAPPSTTTTITRTAPPAPVTGSLRLNSTTLSVGNGKVTVSFTCKSNQPCFGTFTIEKQVRVRGTRSVGPLVCTKPNTTHYRIPAGATKKVKAGLSNACLALLRNSARHSIKGKLSSGPRSGQAGVIKRVTMKG